MTAALDHRGPDGVGFYRDRFASLGHRRLSIVDVATGGQPMANETGELHVVHNGEIFNHLELRELLERNGHRYHSRSDTETILHAWEEYGSECPTRFRGMFAFAIWNRRSRTLFCARDRMGIKPFYYVWDGRMFAFASEIKALLRHPGISAAVDESVLAEYLAYGYSSSERTLFAGIRKLLPGHRLTLTPGELQITRYWSPPDLQEVEPKPDEEWIRECEQRVTEAVRTRLMSDVPLGVFLSGGLDSSVVAALMARMSPERVKSFSVGYAEHTFSELEAARHTARVIGTDHQEIVIGKDDFFNELPRLIWHEDEPLAWSSSVPLFFLARLASDHVKVALTGEGADELFAGYERYRLCEWNRRHAAVYRYMPAAARSAVRRWIANSRLLSAGTRRRLGHTVLGRELDFASLYLDNFLCAFSTEAQRRLLVEPAERFGSAHDGFLEVWRAARGGPLSRLLPADQQTYLVELLMRQDQVSMATGVESRVPFLDHPLVEFAARVPDRLKLRGGTGKWILKRAFRDLLPREIIDRPKLGFPTPLPAWLRGPGSESILAPLQQRDGLLAAYVNRGELDRLLAAHRQGREDATDRLWRLLNLQVWGDVFITRRGARFETPIVAGASA
jgi:asparagine synthase (glutamine-hydrolysing)